MSSDATIQSPDEAVERILEAWGEAGLDMPAKQRGLIDEAGRTGYSLAQSVFARINAAIKRHEPAEEPHPLVADIDAFYTQRIDPKVIAERLSFKTGRRVDPKHVRPVTRERLAQVIQLLAPLTYFDGIVGMKALDDDFLGGLELAFLSRLHVPRNVTEAERTFTAILSLPQEYRRHNANGVYAGQQAFRAQLLFANLLIQNPKRDTELWRFNKRCLETCPDYLLDIPPGRVQGDSSRPAFWLSEVEDVELQEILLARGSETVRLDLLQRRQYRDKIAAHAAVVSRQSYEPKRPLAERVPRGQEDLVEVLQRLDAHLEENHPLVFADRAEGAADEQLDKLDEALRPLRLTDDAATLLKWQNGIDDRQCLLGDPGLSTIEWAYHEYVELAEVLDDTWSRAWFPLFGGGKTMRLVLLTEEQAESTPVFMYSIEDGGLELEHESIESMIETYLEAYLSGIATFDESTEDFRYSQDALDNLRLQISPRAYRYPTHQQNRFDVWQPQTWPPFWRKYKV